GPPARAREGGRPRSRGAPASTLLPAAPAGPRRSWLRGVTPDVRDQREIAGPLDGRRQLPLMARARAAQAARQDLAGVGEEPAEGAVILVVDEAHAGLAERAGLLWAAHRLLLVVVVIRGAGALRGELFFRHHRRADLVLVERDEEADDAFVEL